MSDMLKTLIEKRDALQTEIDALVAAPMAEERSADTKGDFTPDEAARFAEIRDQLPAIDARIAELTAMEDARKAAAEARNKLGAGDSPTVTIRSEERTYAKGNGNKYFEDLAKVAVPSASGDYFGALQRLQRHAVEVETEVRANPASNLAKNYRSVIGRLGVDPELSEVQARTGLTTAVGSGGTFLPPEYLLDEYIRYPRQARVLADLVRKEDLPRGPMTINIPKITGATVVAAQNGQNSAATETDLTDAYIAANVVTIAGQQTVSLQAIEQSAIPFDSIVFEDLQMARELDVETQVVNGSGSSGQLTGLLQTSGITTVTYTDGTPTAVKAWPFIGQAKAKVFDSIFRPADCIVMYPDRWAWFETATDSNGRPLVVPASGGPWNVMGNVDGQLVNAPTAVGRMFGLPVYVTSVIPNNLGGGTNQDEIIVTSVKDLILWESAPVARALPQTLGNQLSVLLQVYEYAAFMPNRLAAATAVISGTGLTTPSF